MEQKKIYTAIAVIIGLILLYSILTFGYYFIKSDYYYGVSTFFDYLPSLLGLAGAIVFYASGFTRSGLLRFFMCFEIISFPFTVWFYVNYFTMDSRYGYSENRFNITFLISIFLTLLLMACCCAGLWLLSKDKVPKLTYIKQGDEIAGQFEPVGHWPRFANRLIDTVVFLFIIYRYVFSNRLFSKDFQVNSYLDFTLIEIPVVILYYLILEGIFNTTAGKCATNTTIVDEQGNRPGFARILRRTFYRIIPFEALSFLGAGARGWHDSLTHTYVVAAINRDEMARHEITLDAELNQPET